MRISESPARPDDAQFPREIARRPQHKAENKEGVPGNLSGRCSAAALHLVRSYRGRQRGRGSVWSGDRLAPLEQGVVWVDGRRALQKTPGSPRFPVVCCIPTLFCRSRPSSMRRANERGVVCRGLQVGGEVPDPKYLIVRSGNRSVPRRTLIEAQAPAFARRVCLNRKCMQPFPDLTSSFVQTRQTSGYYSPALLFLRPSRTPVFRLRYGMSLVAGPGRGGAIDGQLPDELQLVAEKHVAYIQKLDTVCAPSSDTYSQRDSPR